MTAKKRIFIAEDHPDVLETYKKNVVRAGYIVDTASTKDEAIEKIRRRAYHVAMIDINLTDYLGDGNDRSGVDIIREINAWREGTKCIVLSAEQSSEVPVDAHEAGIEKYIIKKRIRAPQDYMDPVNELAKACVIRATGEYADLIAYLSHPDKRWSWEHLAMRALGCDASGLPRLLDEVFAPYLPVLRVKNANHSMSVGADSQQMSGAFWSRAVGHPIWVAIGQKGVSLTAPEKRAKKSDILTCREKGNPFAVWSIDFLARDEFYERVDDLR